MTLLIWREGSNFRPRTVCFTLAWKSSFTVNEELLRYAHREGGVRSLTLSLCSEGINRWNQLHIHWIDWWLNRFTPLQYVRDRERHCRLSEWLTVKQTLCFGTKRIFFVKRKRNDFLLLPTFSHHRFVSVLSRFSRFTTQSQKHTHGEKNAHKFILRQFHRRSVGNRGPSVL